MKAPRVKILGIDFINAESLKVVEELQQGGLLVVPAAPALVNIRKDADYYQALLTADVVIADSGYMALLWNLFRRPKVIRVSGLEFLVDFLADPGNKTKSMMLVDPSAKDAAINQAYLREQGINVSAGGSYVAPWYGKGPIADGALLAMVEQQRPQNIVINLGGGVQEKLGAYLRKNLSYKPAIICTGAAIAFLTGQQAKVPMWADRLFLGWLMRCIENPKLYVPRYLKAFRLAGMVLQHGKNAPL